MGGGGGGGGGGGDEIRPKVKLTHLLYRDTSS